MSLLVRLSLFCGDSRLLASASEEHVGPVLQLVFVLVEIEAGVSLSSPVHAVKSVQSLWQSHFATCGVSHCYGVAVTSKTNLWKELVLLLTGSCRNTLSRSCC